MRRVYLSGPMTGMPENNYPAFHAAAAKLRSFGFDVVNPAELAVGGDELSWLEYMKQDIRQLLDCDSIALLPGWHKSRGARIELMLAIGLGASVLDSATGTNYYSRQAGPCNVIGRIKEALRYLIDD